MSDYQFFDRFARVVEKLADRLNVHTEAGATLLAIELLLALLLALALLVFSASDFYKLLATVITGRELASEASSVFLAGLVLLIVSMGIIILREKVKP